MKSYFIKKYQKFLFPLLLIVNLRICLFEINDNFETGILEEVESDLIDIADYHNISLIISTSKNIYIGTPLSNKTTTTANLNSSSFAATCNENYILVACLEDALLSKINLMTGDSTTLIDYSQYNSIVISNHSCSLSIQENLVFIAISQPASEDKVSFFFS